MRPTARGDHYELRSARGKRQNEKSFVIYYIYLNPAFSADTGNRVSCGQLQTGKPAYFQWGLTGKEI